MNLSPDHVAILRWLDANPMSSASDIAKALCTEEYSARPMSIRQSVAMRLTTLTAQRLTKPTYTDSTTRVYHVTLAGRQYLAGTFDPRMVDNVAGEPTQ